MRRRVDIPANWFTAPIRRAIAGVIGVFYLNRFKIGQRLALALGLVLALMLGVAAGGLWGLQSLGDITRHVLKQDVVLGQSASQIRTLVLTERRFEKDSFINLAEAKSRNDYIAKWRKARTAMQQVLADTRRLELADGDRSDLDAMATHFEVYAAGFESTLSRIESGEITTTQQANAELGKVKKAVHGMEDASEAVYQRATERVAAAGSRVDAVRQRASEVQASLAGLGLLLGIGLCIVLARSIVRPIGSAVRVARTVASGDLSSTIVVTGKDETADLLVALRDMNDGLLRIVSTVRTASDAIATGSSQIAIGNFDLSQRTETQASSLQQTAASIEELTAIVANNAETAQQASRLANGACEVASRGGALIDEVMATMGQISDSSRRIADIIGVIDGIAFQTNILALNAAVEAARAGEHGRGFAVVAEEVRGLARRSADAAREIKGLIATGAATVEHGSRSVTNAGQTMQDIVAQVESVNEMIGRISLASGEQSSGIGQIGQAVSELDRVTQQNAALVEESAAASESLKSQAGNLSQMMQVFRLAPVAA